MRSTLTDSSPARVVITAPWAPTQSPRSSSLTSAKPSSPMTALETNSWSSTPRSAIVANTSLPVSRLSSTRPATVTSLVGLRARLQIGPLGADLGRRCGCGRSGTGTARAPAPRSASTWLLAARPLGGQAAAGQRRTSTDRRSGRRRSLTTAHGNARPPGAPQEGSAPASSASARSTGVESFPLARTIASHRTGRRSRGPVAWRRDDTLPDHRRRTGRQHRGHVRSPAGRRGDDDRARHRRRRRPPVGLHPVEDDDRHRRGHGVPASRSTGMGLEQARRRGRHRGAGGAHRGHQAITCRPAHQPPGRARACG